MYCGMRKTHITRIKNKNHDAWKRISTNMNIDIKELKKKKDSLLSSYRLYRKKVRDSSRSGAGAEEVYKPIWFAYEYIDSFLREGLTVRKTTDTLNQESNVQDSLENQENIDPIPSSEENPATKRRRRNPPELRQAEELIKDSLANLNQALCRNSSLEKEDDCDRYGKILANKLRLLPEDNRLIFMHKIDGMFIQQWHSLKQNPPKSNSTKINSEGIVINSSNSSNMSDVTAITANNYPPVLHLPEHTTKIKILSNKIVSPPSTQTKFLFSDTFKKA